MISQIATLISIAFFLLFSGSSIEQILRIPRGQVSGVVDISNTKFYSVVLAILSFVCFCFTLYFNGVITN